MAPSFLPCECISTLPRLLLERNRLPDCRGRLPLRRIYTSNFTAAMTTSGIPSLYVCSSSILNTGIDLTRASQVCTLWSVMNQLSSNPQRLTMGHRVLDSVHLSMAFASCWIYLIRNNGNPAIYDYIPWSVSSSSALFTISQFPYSGLLLCVLLPPLVRLGVLIFF